MNKKLTIFEASCIVAGNGIGGGLMTLPFLFDKVGMPVAILVLIVAFIVTSVLHIIVASMLLNSKNGNGILSIFSEFLFIGKLKTPLTACFFVLVLITLIFNISAYVSGGSEIFGSIIGSDLLVSKFIFFVLAIVVPLKGIKALGFSEKVSVLFMAAFTLSLTILSVINGRNSIVLYPESFNSILALYGLAMFSFSSLFAVSQVVDGLERDVSSIKKSIVCGIGINLVISLLICLSVIIVSETVTEVAIIGWSKALGNIVRILSSLLILFAMLTSFWSISLALSDIVCEQFNIKKLKHLAFICSTLPCLLLSVISGGSFTAFMGLAGGAVAVIIALLLLPAYLNSQKLMVIDKSKNGQELLGKASGSTALVVVIGFFYLLMAVGAVLAAI